MFSVQKNQARPVPAEKKPHLRLSTRSHQGMRQSRMALRNSETLNFNLIFGSVYF